MANLEHKLERIELALKDKYSYFEKSVHDTALEDARVATDYKLPYGDGKLHSEYMRIYVEHIDFWYGVYGK